MKAIMDSHLLYQLDRKRYKINFIHTLLVQQRKTGTLSNSRHFEKLNPIPCFRASVACFALFCFMVIRSHEEAFSEKYTVIEKITGSGHCSYSFFIFSYYKCFYGCFEILIRTAWFMKYV